KLGEKADLVIKKLLSKHTRPWIVISSDREISDFAYKKDFTPLTADEFEQKLYSFLYGTGNEEAGEFPDYDEEDFYIKPIRQKGNPRKPSRRQKRKLQALKKL
ncbi:MAG: hypothetical protein L0922_08280, partial [Candidatus Mariimomonas ferrooxydans]